MRRLSGEEGEMKAILEWLCTWAAISAFAIVMAYFFIQAWDAQAPEWERHGSVIERDLKPFMSDFAGGRSKTTGFGYYDRKRERGR
jgi:hypothetical protein